MSPSRSSPLSQDLGVNVDIPKEGGGKIRIEGPTAEVLKAKVELETMIHKRQDEVTLDLNIEARLHKLIIGRSGTGIKEVSDRVLGA